MLTIEDMGAIFDQKGQKKIKKNGHMLTKKAQKWRFVSSF